MNEPTPSPTASPAGLLDRIRTKRDERGLDQADLAEAIGVSESVMSRIMNDGRKLSAAELGLLADRLGVTTGYLLGKSASNPRPFAMAARLGAMSARLREDHQSPELEPVFARARRLLELRGVLERIVEAAPRVPAPAVTPSTSPRWVLAGERTAERVREALRLGNEPIDDLVELVEGAFGVDVAVEPMPADLHGVFLTDAGERAAAGDAYEAPAGAALAVMLVDSNDSYGRQRFTLAHELAHLVFGDADTYWADYRTDQGNDSREKRANVFAAAFLAPAAAVKELWEARGTAPVLEDAGGPEGREKAGDWGIGAGPGSRYHWLAGGVCDVSLRFGMSVEAAIYRCDNLKLLTSEDNAFLRGAGATTLIRLAGRTAERDELAAHINVVSPPRDLVDKALFAYSQGMVGIEPLAQLWRSDDPEELRADLAEQGWAPAFA